MGRIEAVQAEQVRLGQPCRQAWKIPALHQAGERTTRGLMSRSSAMKGMPAFLLVMSVLALAVLPAACSEPAPVPAASITVADRSINEGETFSVEVLISTDTPCRGAQCELAFDPDLMQCDSVTEGGFFRDWATANGASTIMIPQSPSIDNVQGRVATTGIAVMGGSGGGAKGSGVLLAYHFTALADGTVSPGLSDVVLVDEHGLAMAAAKVDS